MAFQRKGLVERSGKLALQLTQIVQKSKRGAYRVVITAERPGRTGSVTLRTRHL